MRNRREEGRAVENAKRSATVETTDRPRGCPCRLMLPGPREVILQRDNQAQRLSVDTHAAREGRLQVLRINQAQPPRWQACQTPDFELEH